MRVPSASTDLAVQDRAAAGASVVPAGDGAVADHGGGAALVQVFGLLGGASGARWDRSPAWPLRAHWPARAAQPQPARHRSFLVLPFLLMHPGLVPAGFVLPAAAGIAVAAYRIAYDPAVPRHAAPGAASAAVPGSTAVPAGTALALDAAEQEVATLRSTLVQSDWDSQGTASWREGLRQEADRLRQRREAARATLAASHKLMADQPGSVLALRETTAQQAGEEARATLLRLQVEREHLVAQYVPTYPAVRELDRQIAIVKAGLEEGRRPNVSRTREVRNPALDALSQRAALAQVDLAAAEAQLGEVDRQLGQAEARRTELAAVAARLQDAERRRDALRAAAAELRQVPAPVPAQAVGVAPLPWTRVLFPAGAGLGCGALLAGVLALAQRRALAKAAPARPAPPEILPPPAWPLMPGPDATPEAIWSKPAVGPAQDAPGRLRAPARMGAPARVRAPVGTGCQWNQA